MARTKASAPDPSTDSPSVETLSASPRWEGEAYTVVARRYRPQRFEDVVGQDHVVRALRNAIRMDRVAQAYLFSGTRGVGKTSMARIFAKALNCERGGPTETPCNECDTCRAIALGQDVDVIEIDGASNNGVEAVRELRQNAGLRPSRSRFKIYYIDEVHMLSTSAFNALLKTLEEPPSHVKFVFATTEPNKIPITVLSRCQRFDFAGIGPEQIVDQLASICEREGIKADREALHVVARRAAGSMRDAQSLLEQLLSSGAEHLTADRVHELLGIAGDDRVLTLLDALADRSPGRALEVLDQAVNDGVQPTDVLNASIEFLRDVMVVSAGAEVAPLAALPGQREQLEGLAGRWTLDTVIAAQQILAETRGRLRGSPFPRLMVELAFCRVARLENLTELSEVIARLSGQEAGAPPPGPDGAVKKKSVEPLSQAAPAPRPSMASVSAPTPAPEAEVPPHLGNGNGHGTGQGRAEAVIERPPPAPLGRDEQTSRPSASVSEEQDGSVLQRARSAWQSLIDRAEELKLPAHFKRLEPSEVSESGLVVVAVPAAYNYLADRCNAPELRSKIEGHLAEALGRGVSVRFDREASTAPEPSVIEPGSSAHQAVLEDDLAQQLVARFEAQLRRVEVEPERRAGSDADASADSESDPGAEADD
ncbi:DNA polymerase III subunit gamma/tau [Tautonia rosea]|uniref:DNA polymerase III subunit gamma/tau n=1 Tax=Tautonia rosea TaxID=2728037 RepID=UPI0028F3E9F3|nr:DNA polymerase III subunit gamma/tau [Tautonia rosea]